MSRKKNVTTEPSIFRFMCIREKNTNYHLDFPTKEEALAYCEELNDSKIEWYGVYELSPLCNTLISITNKRLQPYNDTIYVAPKEDTKERRKRKRKSREK